MPAQHKFSWHFFTIVFWISTTSGEMLKALLEFLLALFGTNPKYLYEEIQRGIWFLIWQLPKQLSSNGHGRLLCWTNVLHACWAWLEQFFSYNCCPNAYELHFHVGIVTAFIFLLLNLIGSLTVISWYRFQVPKVPVLVLLVCMLFYDRKLSNCQVFRVIPIIRGICWLRLYNMTLLLPQVH